MKYPRTYHLPWSPGAGRSDDKVLDSIEPFLRNELVVTEKMDGSNVCMEQDALFSRSHAGPPDHPSFNAFKALHATVKSNIPDKIQVFGEWCFAKHSIWYDRLPNYFLMFGVRVLETHTPWWLPWDGVQELAGKLGVPTVPMLASITVRTEDDLKLVIESFANGASIYGRDGKEGVVIRTRNGWRDELFSTCIAKHVRKDHVQTDEHWKHQEIVRNLLADGP